MTAVDVLLTPTTHAKARLLLGAVYDGALMAGMDARVVRDGKVRKGALIVLYGLGGSDRVQYAGKPNVISFDAGYWERKLELSQRKYRVSVGGFHCPDRIFQGPNPGPERWESAGIPIARHGGDLTGPILLIGNGPKSNRIGASSWCAETLTKLRGRFPNKEIWYRPKPKRAHDRGMEGLHVADGKDIDKVLAQCSLVVCRHSNVAVDCARVGTDCACEDGAGAAIYSNIGYGSFVSYDMRKEFLHRLSWWQWSIAEMQAGMFWPWMLKQLGNENAD